MGIFMISMGVIQRYAIVAGIFEICKHTENRLFLKLVEIGNYFQLQLERMIGIYMYQFSCKNLQRNSQRIQLPL